MFNNVFTHLVIIQMLTYIFEYLIYFKFEYVCVFLFQTFEMEYLYAFHL